MSQAIQESQFYRYVLPSTFTMLLTGFYTIVDGFFIGHAVGDVGLAAVGLVWPVAALLMAVGIGVGTGGSVLASIRRGAGDQMGTAQAEGSTAFALVCAGALLTALLLPLHPLLARLLGAEGEVFDAAVAYLRVIALGGSMQILASGLTPMIRNSGRTIAAMLIMCTGLVANIALDALLTMVVPWGMAGAALATITAQAVTVILSLVCLLRGRAPRLCASHLKPNPPLLLRLLGVGLSPFGLSLIPNLITVFLNWQCLAYGGDTAVAAYSVINYFFASVVLLLGGVGEGMQPLISFFRGAGDSPAMARTRRRGVHLALGMGVVSLLCALPARTLLPAFFGASGKTAVLIEAAMPLFCAAFPMMAVSKLFTSYFYAGGDTLRSNLLVYADPLVFTPLCLLVLPRLWGLEGVWLAMPGTQLLTLLLLAILCRWGGKKSTDEEAHAVGRLDQL